MKQKTNRLQFWWKMSLFLGAAAVAQEVDAEMLRELDFYLNLETVESLELDKELVQVPSEAGGNP